MLGIPIKQQPLAPAVQDTRPAARPHPRRVQPRSLASAVLRVCVCVGVGVWVGLELCVCVSLCVCDYLLGRPLRFLPLLLLDTIHNVLVRRPETTARVPACVCMRVHMRTYARMRSCVPTERMNDGPMLLPSTCLRAR